MLLLLNMVLVMREMGYLQHRISVAVLNVGFSLTGNQGSIWREQK